MKKAVAIFLLGLYCFAAAGATIHAHYCMNRLINWSILPGSQKACTNCGMPKEKSHGCCRDEERHVQMHTDHQLALSNYATQDFSQPIVVTPFLYYSSSLNTQVAFIVHPVSNPPPHALSNKLYLHNSIFLI